MTAVALLVIDIQQAAFDGAGEPFEEGAQHWQFHEQLTPQAGDLVIKKHASSAFENTDLQAGLDALGAVPEPTARIANGTSV